MRLLSLLFILIFSSAAFARGGSGSTGERWTAGGYYGLGFINPKNINDAASSQSTTPKLGSISTDTIYGGFISYMLSPVFQFKGTFEFQDGKNSTNTTSPVISGAGYEVSQNEIWGSLNYFLAHTGKHYIYIGGSIGYPTYSHVTQTLTTKTDFDADKTIGFAGQVGAGVMLGEHISLFAEGAYQSLVSGDVKNSAGTVLLVNGSKAKLDLSGPRIVGGLGIVF